MLNTTVLHNVRLCILSTYLFSLVHNKTNTQEANLIYNNSLFVRLSTKAYAILKKIVRRGS